MKPRHHVRLDDELTERLDALALKPGSSKSAILSDALRAYLNRKAGNEIDDLVKRRLDKISNTLGRVERDQQILLESLALFINYQFTITAPMPEADASARAIGQDRFQAFIEQVGRRISSGQGMSQEITQQPAESAGS
jgi:predicted transcriptional regulator